MPCNKLARNLATTLHGQIDCGLETFFQEAAAAVG